MLTDREVYIVREGDAGGADGPEDEKRTGGQSSRSASSFKARHAAYRPTILSHCSNISFGENIRRICGLIFEIIHNAQ
jgi:hypothetical protein